MLEIQGDWDPMLPNWTVYFGVADCDGTLETVAEQGGSVLMGPMEVENVGRFAYLRDPPGATFAVIQFAHWT
jgi:predicted enzyme related to lactoylglutathione lyase